MARRIGREFEKLKANPPDWCTVSMPNESDIHTWHAIIQGPDDSPYAKGKFVVVLELPQDYPFKHPTMKFETKVYHPNVKTKTGEICDHWLKDQWSPQLTIEKVLMMLRQFMKEPNVDQPLEAEIAELFRKNPAKYKKTVEEWVKKHAKA